MLICYAVHQQEGSGEVETVETFTSFKKAVRYAATWAQAAREEHHDFVISSGDGLSHVVKPRGLTIWIEEHHA